VHHYNKTARPFQWKFTIADLDDLLTRIEQHEQKNPTPISLPCQPQPEHPKNLRRRPITLHTISTASPSDLHLPCGC
jgi:hypothetical protein